MQGSIVSPPENRHKPRGSLFEVHDQSKSGTLVLWMLAGQ